MLSPSCTVLYCVRAILINNVSISPCFLVGQRPDDGDDGCGGERVVRRRRVAGEDGAVDGKRKRGDGDPRPRGRPRLDVAETKVFEIERLLDKRMVECQVGKGSSQKKDFPQYLILWKDFPPSAQRGSGPCSAASPAASRVRWWTSGG